MKTFKEFYHQDEGFDYNIKEHKKAARLLKRRLNAFTKKRTEKDAHRLANIVIELFNRFNFTQLFNFIEEEYQDKERKQILFTFMEEVLDTKNSAIIFPDQNHRHEESAKMVKNLKEQGLVSLEHV